MRKVRVGIDFLNYFQNLYVLNEYKKKKILTFRIRLMNGNNRNIFIQEKNFRSTVNFFFKVSF